MNTSLCKGIDWVGYVDWTVRDFHSYETTRGATYNAYLIRDEKIALIDAVKAPHVRILLDQTAALTPLDKVDYVICNHAEPDHSGGLSEVMKAMPNAKLVCDAKCRKALSLYHDTTDWEFVIVATGDTISLGERTLQFIETPMLHWPESMFTYCQEEGILFSMDAFGQHYATAHRFDDEEDLSVILDEAMAYYATIVVPFNKQVAATLVKAAGLDIKMIAPSHGVIWRSFVPRIIEAYQRWSSGRTRAKVVVFYDTMWDSTGTMARAIVDGATVDGVTVKLIHVRNSSLTNLAKEILDASAVAVGTSTLNRGMMPMIGAALTFLEGLRPGDKMSLSFGSYGWAGSGPEAVAVILDRMGWEPIIEEPLTSQYRPDDGVLDECRRMGALLAEKALNVVSSRT